MTAGSCGCSTKSCGCCEGTRKLTPADTSNRPGLSALHYRVGRHGTFLATMKARLANLTLDAPGADGQTIETFQSLRGLTTRNASDPSIALLEGWATVGDILTFYQERIANEGYLRTATERGSVLELARLVGYRLRPGVSATAHLAYLLDENATEPVEIPPGARSQSVPGPGETPQAFETSDPLTARSDWNNLQARLKRPQNIAFENILFLREFYVAGTNTKLKSDDLLLFVFAPEGSIKPIRTVAKIEAQPADDRTLITLVPLPLGTAEAMKELNALLILLKQRTDKDPQSSELFVLKELTHLHQQIYRGRQIKVLDWIAALNDAYDGQAPVEVLEPFQTNVKKIVQDLGETPKIATTSPDAIVPVLLKDPEVQAANALQLPRSLEKELGPGSDAHSQLLVDFAPRLKDKFYQAWSAANVSEAPPKLMALYGFHVRAPIFGASASKLPKYSASGNPTVLQLDTPDKWDEWTLESDELPDTVFMDQAYEGVVPESFAIIDTPDRDRVGQIKRLIIPINAATSVQRAAYGLTGKSTQINFALPWRPELDPGLPPKDKPNLDAYRRTLVTVQAEPLTVVEETITESVKGQEIALAKLYDGLTSGRWVIFYGERADLPEVSGVKVSELLMVSNLRQDFDKNLPGDKTHTTLILATPTAYEYKRDTLTIYGNVVKATHGETRNEPLGNGDGSQAFQSFDLKQPPLTFVPAPNAAGVDSTLHIFVNDIEWHETDSLAGLKPKDRMFVTKTDDDDKTTVTFGNGTEGSRLPSGVLNVNSIYRSGIGKVGNVKAEQISLLQTRPLGVNGVINPLPSSGGADKESRDQARENAPLAVMALDRLVSLQDYADFTRTFAGIAKASARLLSDGYRQLVHLTIAGADDIPIDPVSDLYQNLLIALRELGSDTTAVQVDMRELVALVLSANLRLLPDYKWEPVATAVRESLLVRFGFHKRALGQPALVCEIIAAIQQVEGVAYVDVDSFGGVPEKTTKNGKRTLVTLSEINQAIQEITKAPTTTTTSGENMLKIALLKQNPTTSFVPAELADYSGGVLRPAQLAIFKSSVQDTIVLNQIT